MRRLIMVDDPQACSLDGHDGDVVSVSEHLSPAMPDVRTIQDLNAPGFERFLIAARLTAIPPRCASVSRRATWA